MTDKSYFGNYHHLLVNQRTLTTLFFNCNHAIMSLHNMFTVLLNQYTTLKTLCYGLLGDFPQKQNLCTRKCTTGALEGIT